MTIRNSMVAMATTAWLAIAGVVSPAPAIPITGNFSIVGANSYDLTANTVSILSNTINIASGSFLPLLNTSLTFDKTNPINYNTALTGLLFHGINGLTFTVSGTGSATEHFNPDSLDITANGILTLTGFDPTQGTFHYTTQGPQGVAVSFSATTIAVPGPVVGAGFPGLLAAAGALVALARARRRRTHLT
jgi:hypothetical protein